jgi:hypothetical protein
VDCFCSIAPDPQFGSRVDEWVSGQGSFDDLFGIHHTTITFVLVIWYPCLYLRLSRL